MEIALTLPFVFLGIMFVYISDTFGEEAIPQKLFFIGTGWLMGILGVASIHVVAGSTGYNGIQTLAEGTLFFLIPSLLFWTIYIVAKTFTDISTKIWPKIGS